MKPVYTPTHTHTHTHVNIHTHAHKLIYIYIFVSMSAYARLCICVCALLYSACVFECACVSMCVRVRETLSFFFSWLISDKSETWRQSIYACRFITSLRCLDIFSFSRYSSINISIFFKCKWIHIRFLCSFPPRKKKWKKVLAEIIDDLNLLYPYKMAFIIHKVYIAAFSFKFIRRRHLEIRNFK